MGTRKESHRIGRHPVVVLFSFRFPFFPPKAETVPPGVQNGDKVEEPTKEKNKQPIDPKTLTDEATALPLAGLAVFEHNSERGSDDDPKYQGTAFTAFLCTGLSRISVLL